MKDRIKIDGRNGVFAALLAAEGMTGPAPIFEGDLGIMKLLTGPFTLDSPAKAMVPSLVSPPVLRIP